MVETRSTTTDNAKLEYIQLITVILEQNIDGPISQGLSDLIGEPDIGSIMILSQNDL